MAIQVILINNNPISEIGAKQLRETVDKKPFVSTLGVEGINYTDFITNPKRKTITLDGHYRLNLKKNVLLNYIIVGSCISIIIKSTKIYWKYNLIFFLEAKWEYVTLDDCPITVNDKWNVL